MKSLAVEEVSVPKKSGLTSEEFEYLDRIEKATFRGFEKLIDRATGLPVDIASVFSGDVLQDPKNPYFNKTSPTNMGLGFLYLVLAKERGNVSEKTAYERLLQMMDTLEKLETHEGFLYNWYYLTGKPGETPKVSQDRFVSSLDNGDLDISLMAAAGAFPNTELSKRIDSFLEKKNYNFFFNKNPQNKESGMLSVGYDEAKKRYHAAEYSIFNIEGRMTVLVAILKDRIPDSAWKNQSRLVKTYTTLEGKQIPVVSPWGGSLYETLFADEIVGGAHIAPRAFLRNALNMIEVHQDKGKRISKTGIWGLSNGEVPGENRYEMTGVPEIAYNRFPGEFITIYSSFLSVRYAAKQVIGNLKAMEILNPRVYSSQYGFTDSIDPKTGVTNQNILSLDKGMELLSLANFLSVLEGKKEIPDYFWSYLKGKGWDEKARSLLKGEEDNPSFQALSGNGTNSKREAKKVSPIDLLAVRQEIGTFYEPDRAHASFKLVDWEKGKQMIEVQYDVTKRYSFSGLYLKLDDLDISHHHALKFQIKGKKEKGFAKSIKVELKWKGVYVHFEHVLLKADWDTVRIELPPGHSKVDELSFVFENSMSEGDGKGEVLIRSLSFV